MKNFKNFFEGEYIVSLHGNPIEIAKFFGWGWCSQSIRGGFPKGATDTKVTISAPKYKYLGCLNLGNIRVKSSDKAFAGPTPEKVWKGNREFMPTTCFVQVYESEHGDRIGFVANPDDQGYYEPVVIEPEKTFDTIEEAFNYYTSI